MIKSRPHLPSAFVIGGVVALLITLLLYFSFFDSDSFKTFDWLIVAGPLMLWFLIGMLCKYFELNTGYGVSKLTVYYIFIFIVTLILIINLLLGYQGNTPTILLGALIGLLIISIPLDHIVNMISQHTKGTDPNLKYTLVAGIGNNAENIEKAYLNSRQSKHKVKGFIKCNNKEECSVGQDRVVGDLNNIHQYLRDNPVDEIVIALKTKQSKKIRNIMMAADYYGVRVKYVPDYEILFGKNYKTTKLGDIEAINVRQLPLDETYAFLLKNTFDKIFSAIVLLLLSPVFLAIAVLIKLESSGPVFYCPVRIGKSGKPFKVFKFRSMRENDSTLGGTLSTQVDDNRITKFGRILRKYSLDELPQFMNVLLGDMSVVGPRPHRSFLNKQFQESVDKYMIRYYFKPGITGWAQVNGWRGPTDTNEQKCMRTKFDLWYVENWSLVLDLKIIWLTVFGKNVHKNAF